MASDDDPHGFEDAWADLRPRVLFEPPKKATPGRAFLGVGRGVDEECSYPGYKRVGVPLFLDGADMTAHFDPVEVAIEVSWIGLWFKSVGGRPFYRKALPEGSKHIQAGDSLSVNLSVKDESGLVTSMLASLDLL
jgi:hypothetical protein